MDQNRTVSREESPFWVFGYGSLMWDPGFPFVEQRRARVSGFERRLCLWSIRYRGTPVSPGLVLGLDARSDGCCTGIAYRVTPGEVRSTRKYLKGREMVSYAYRETILPVTLLGEGVCKAVEVEALSYVMDPAHPQYASGLSERECAEVIAASRGQRGENREYLDNTLRHLAELNVREPGLERIAQQVARIQAAAA